MKRLFTLCMVATLLLAGSAFAETRHFVAEPNASSPPEIISTVHIMTVKNAFGWLDALEADNSAPADPATPVTVDVTNCFGYGPLPSPLSLKAGEAKAHEGASVGYGLNGDECYDHSLYKSFAVVDLSVKNGTANVVTRAEYTTSIGQDLFEIPALPNSIGYNDFGYEFSSVWNGDGKPGSRSAYIAFVNIGAEGNVRIRAVNDATGAADEETVYLHKGDTFYPMTVKLPFGRVVITVPPPSYGGVGATPETLTPRIYAVIFRGHSGAGVAKAIVPRRLTAAP